MTKLIILRGYPGSGKTTVAKELKARGLGEFIDHNAILTFFAKIAGDDEGIYDEIAQLELAICKKLLNEDRDVIVARGFSSLKSMAPYEAVAKSLGADIKIIRLDVSKDELMHRVQSPERKLDFNPTVDETSLVSWMNDNPIQDHRDEFLIDNEKPLDIVITRLTSML